MSSQDDPRSLEAIGRGKLALAAVVIAAIVYASGPKTGIGHPDVRLRLDPNRAPRQVLVALPGLGPARVAAIETARASSPFRSLDDLDRRVKGIGPSTAASLRPHFRFHSP